jgi:alkyl sulfatase BDS1-like metallo-beta-lactamase superfamily hydrolase
MPVFLSDEWIAALDEVATAAAPVEALAGVALTVLQVVEVAPDREVRYHLRIEDGSVHVAPGSTDDADLTLFVDGTTARALHAGELNAQRALASGHLRVRGDLNRMLGSGDAFAVLGDLFAGVRAETTYDA